MSASPPATEHVELEPAHDGGARIIRVRVRRSDPAARREFTVRAHDPMTVLDLLREIQREHDPSLAFRYSCRVAMCGTCGIRVDGQSALACHTVLDTDLTEISLAPLGGLPVVRDLVVDTRPFWAEWASVMPWFVPDEHTSGQLPAGAPADVEVDRALGCISCGACYSACELARHGNGYLGPAALNRALALIADPRDGAAEARLGIVSGGAGVDRCHYVGSCTPACPVGVDPARSIVQLRRLRLTSRA